MNISATKVRPKTAAAAQLLARLFPLLAIMTAVLHVAAAGLPPLTLERAVDESGSFSRLRWPSQPGLLYRLQTAIAVGSGGNANWVSCDAILASSTNAVLELPSIPATSAQFFRLAAQPEIFDLQPAWVDSGDSNAVLYILGQYLPADATVVINGQNFTPVIVNSNGVWATVSLDGLPPGTSLNGTIAVVDNATGSTNTEYKLQSGFIYATAPAAQQLQGPPADPPASPVAQARGRGKTGHVTLMKAFDDESNARHTKTGHVTLMKAFDDGSDDVTAARHTKTGHVTLMKAFDDENESSGSGRMAGATGDGKKDFKGHVTLMKQEIAPGGGGGCDDLDVFLATGEVRDQETDLAIPGVGLDFAWTRTYRSRTGPTTEQGAGWDFSYNVSLEAQSDGTMILRPGNGRADTFYPTGTNTWTRDEYFCEIGDLDGDGMPDVRFADTSRWLFNPLGTPAGGKLSQIIDRNGNTIRLSYDTLGRLTTIVDDLGRTNTVAHTAAGQVDSVTDFSGRKVRYEYDTHGDLTAVISPSTSDFPGGITNRYTYTSGFKDDRLNHNLASCTDGKGQTWLQVFYQPATDPASMDFDAVDHWVCGGTSHLRRFATAVSPTNGFAVVKAVVRDAVGNVTESFYDSRQRCVRLLEYTGRAPDLNAPTTEIDNRPAGKLRADDPDSFETRWKWNPDSLCAVETLPDGERTQFIYERDFDAGASAGKKGDCRVVRELAVPGAGGDLDGDGRPDFTERSWHFDYDPRFGSPPPAAMSRGIVLTKPSTGGTGPGTVLLASEVTAAGLRLQPYRFAALARGIIVPEPAGVAIKTKGTGAEANRTANPGGDGPVTGRYAREAFLSTAQSARLAKRYRRVLLQQGRISPTPDVGPFNGQCSSGLCYDTLPPRNKDKPFLMPVEDFVTRVTDPHGNVTTSDYDANGNLVRKRKIGRTSYGSISMEADFVCNPYGQLTALTNIADANGRRRVDAFNYYTNGPQGGQLQSVVIDLLGLGLTTSYEYDPRGNVSRVVDPRGNDWLFSYNALDQCVSRTTPDNSFGTRTTTAFIYDANGNVVASSTALRDDSDTFLHDVVSRAEYDFLDRCTAVADQVSPGVFVTNHFDYNANGNLLAVHSPLAVSGVDPQAVARFEYDERGLLFRSISPPAGGVSATNEYSYTVNGMRDRINQLESHLSGLGLLTYDGFSRLASYTDPMGNVVSCGYDRNDNLTRVRCYGETNDVPGSAGNQLLAETRFTYDGLDRCVQQADSFFDIVTLAPIGKGQATNALAYAPNGDCTSVTDDNGHTTSFTCDTAGRLASVTDPRPNITAYTYDECGNVTGVTQTDYPDPKGSPQQFTVTRAFDKLHRLTRTVDNVGNTHQYVYDSLGRPVHHVNAKGVLSVVEYDDLGRGRKTWMDRDYNGTIGGEELQESRAFDANSQIVSVTDANANTTIYAYDSLGRRTTITEADGTVCSLIWSPRSNVLRVQDANGTIISNRFDALDRCVRRDITPGTRVAATTRFETFTYDGLSRCVSAANDVSAATFAFDSLGNRVCSTQDGLLTTRTFDGAGNCLSMTYPSGRVVGFAYNELDEIAGLSSRTDSGSPPITLATYAYEGPGRVSRIARANGVTTRASWNGLVSPPNAAGDFGWGQVSTVSHELTGGGTLDQRACTYDRNQNKTSRAQTTPFYLGGPTTTNLFAYDALDRLTQFSRATGGPDDFARLYRLDNNGNRQFASFNGVVEPYLMDATLPSPADFQMNQYTVTPFGTQTCDENGNLVGRSSTAGALQFAYDYADRLVEVNALGSGKPLPVASYSYDALGRRIAKTVFPSGLPPVTTQYAWGDEDCDGVILEERENGVLQRTFVLPHMLEAQGRSGRKQHAASVLQDSGAFLDALSGEVYYPLTDDLGSTLALTDAAGHVLERYDYDDYGLPSFLTSDGTPLTGSDGQPATSSPAGNRFLFHGMEWEAETGLYLTGAEATGRLDPYKNFRSHGMGDGATGRSWKEFSPADDQLKGNPRHRTVYIDPKTGRSLTPVRSPSGDGSANDPFGGNPWTLKKEEGGRHTPLNNKRSPST